MSFNPRLLKSPEQESPEDGRLFHQSHQVFVMDRMLIHLSVFPGLTVLKYTTIMLLPPPHFSLLRVSPCLKDHTSTLLEEISQRSHFLVIAHSKWCHWICGLQRRRFNSGTKDSLSHSQLCVDFIKVTGIKKASSKRQWQGEESTCSLV